MLEWPSTRPGISVVSGSSTAMAPDSSRLASGPAASTRSPLTRTAQPSCMVSPSKTRAGFRRVTAPGSRAGGCGSAAEARMRSNRMRRRASIRQLYASFGGAGDFACECQLALRLVVRLQAADPDIAIPHGVVVVLQHQGFFGAVRRVMGYLPIDHGAHDFFVVVHHDAVIEHGDECRLDQFFAIEARRVE